MLQLRMFVHQRMSVAIDEILDKVEKTIMAALSEAEDKRYKIVESPQIDPVPQEPVALDLPSTSGAQGEDRNGTPVMDQLKGSTTTEGPNLILNASSAEVSKNSPGLDVRKWNYVLLDAHGKMLEIRGEQGELLGGSEIQQVVIPSPGMEMMQVSSVLSAALMENRDHNEELLNNSEGQTEEDQEALANKRSRKGRHPCHICGRKFRLITALLNHIQKHAGKDRANDCTLCGVAHNSRNRLVSHMKECHKNVIFCRICGKTFASQAYLNRHQNTHNKFKCQECGRMFSVKSKLTAHMNVHTENRPYLCDICGKAFKRAYQITQHKKIHSEERPHLCDVCGKGFRHSQEVQNHRKIHTGEKNYACTLCDKRFTLSHHLKVHMTYHTGEKPYSCDVCKKHFYRREYLKRHMVLHTGEEPYVCHFCGMSFRFPDGLKCHIKKSHETAATDPGDKPTPDA